MAQINLAPGTEYAGLLRKRRRRVWLASFAVSVLLLAAWGGLFVYEQRLIQVNQAVMQGLAGVESEITRLGDAGQRVTLFEGRTETLSTLLSRHISWEPLLRDLERLIPSGTVVNQLKVNIDEGEVEIAGQTSDLDVVAQTLASLVTLPSRESIFTSASLENSNRVQQETVPGSTAVHYEFSARLIFDREKLLYAQ